MKEVDNENKASTTISAAFLGHKGRQHHSFIKSYPEIAKKRLEDVKNMHAQELLKNKPSQNKGNVPLHLQIIEEQKTKNKKKLDDALLSNPVIKKDLVNRKQQSTTDFLNMAFTSPKRDIVEMMTPQKVPTSTSITPYRENRSLLDFVMGGTPQKTAEQLKTEKKINRLKEVKKDISKPKQRFEYNDLKTEFTGKPNPNKEIASSILSSAVKSKHARKELKQMQQVHC